MGIVDPPEEPEKPVIMRSVPKISKKRKHDIIIIDSSSDDDNDADTKSAVGRRARENARLQKRVEFLEVCDTSH